MAYLKKTDQTLLEIGCGKGKLLLNAHKKGINVYGIDLNLRVNREVLDNNIPVAETDLKQLNKVEAFPSKFDAFIIWHVLEHIEDPKDFLSDLLKCCKQETELIIAVPNENSIQHQLTNRSWYHLDPLRHYIHYNPGTITHLLDTCGFQVNKIHHNSTYLNFIGNLISYGNLIFPIQNLPFNLVRRNKNALKGHSSISIIIQVILYGLYAIIGLIPLIIVTLLEQLLKKSGTIVVNCSPKVEA